MQDRKEHVNIISPEEGKRYRLNVRTPVGRLTIGKVKQCLAAASSCPIPLSDMVLHLNGVPLSNDHDLCESLGIANGATLSVEARTPPPPQQPQQEPSFHRSARKGTGEGVLSEFPPPSSNTHLTPYESHPAGGTPSEPPLQMSEQRRLVELQTLEQQDAMLHKDGTVRDDILKHTLHHVDDEMDQVNLRRRQLERQRENADEELRRMREKEAAAAKERERLAALRAQESLRATERAAQLAERREQLRAEQEAARAVALLKLENEKKKATLAQQKALLEAERERAALEQDSFEATTKARELALRSREIDMEHQRLARIREARALEADRRAAVKQRLHYYAQLGVEPPRALQREAALLLIRDDDGDSDDDDVDEDDFGEEDGTEGGDSQVENELVVEQHPRGAVGKSQRRSRLQPRPQHRSSRGTDGLVQSRGPSTAAAAATHGRTTKSAQPRDAPSRPQRGAAATSTQPANSPFRNHNFTNTDNNNSQNGVKDDGAVAVVPDGGFYDARENAEANLRRLGDDLAVPEPLQFDDSDTCVISIDGEYTLLITYDAATERLYLYSTLLAALPPRVQHTAEGRLRLYEFLLEASLLGREMCGGGVGASLRNNFVLMSASLYMPTSQPWSLRTLTPQFLHCLQHWREKLRVFLDGLERDGSVGSTSSSAGGHAPYASYPHAPNGFTATATTTTTTAGANSGAAPTMASAPRASPSQPPTAYPPPPPMPHNVYEPSRVYSVSPTRSPVSSRLSPSQASPSQQQQQQQPKVIPVLGLEVTGTVLVNGMPTHYDNGVLVVNAAGPSVLAGIQPNDFVEELNGVPIRCVGDFRRVIAEQLVPGMVVPVRINRGGVAMIVTVRVEAAWSL